MEFVNTSDKTLLLKSTVQRALVEKFLQGDEKPCDDKVFSETKKIREQLTSDLKLLIENFLNQNFYSENDNKPVTFYSHTKIDTELLALILILCGQNSSLQPWNNETIIKNCDNILSQILNLFNCKNAPQLITKNCKINLVKNIFQILCTDLTVSTWKYFPASVLCYKWILEMLEQPELSQHLQFVLPPALLLIDDFVTENRIIGAQCLNHIVKNTTVAELQLCGHGEVIYSALMPLLRIKEVDLVHFGIITLVTLTTKLEFDLRKKDPTKWSKFDSILEILLENMELEQITDLRNCYISNLSILIEAVGSGIIRWSKRLLRIFDEYIQTAGKYSDEKATNNCVKAIEKYIAYSEEVTSFYAKHLMFTLFMALHSTSKCNTEMQSDSKEITIRCIKKLYESLLEIERKEIKTYLQKNFSSFCIFL